MNMAELLQLKQLGAVGDISCQFFDKDGKLIVTDFNERVIGIKFEKLKNIPNVVGVSSGLDKFKVIRGALHGNLINTLITDSQIANLLLDIV